MHISRVCLPKVTYGILHLSAAIDSGCSVPLHYNNLSLYFIASIGGMPVQALLLCSCPDGSCKGFGCKTGAMLSLCIIPLLIPASKKN